VGVRSFFFAIADPPKGDLRLIPDGQLEKPLKPVTKKGTIVSNMGTKDKGKGLSSVLFGKTKQAIWGKLGDVVENLHFLYI
jgi:hypothetical protein